MDTVCVEVEVLEGVDVKSESLKKQLVKIIKDNVGLSMAVQLKSLYEIPRSQGGKLSRIVDKRSNVSLHPK